MGISLSPMHNMLSVYELHMQPQTLQTCCFSKGQLAGLARITVMGDQCKLLS